MNSFIKSYNNAINQITSKIYMVEDNMAYYNKLVDQANINVLFPLSRFNKITRPIKRNDTTTFASLHKMLLGSPHEHHSYLLDWDVKALGVRLNIGKDSFQVKNVVDDMARLISISYECGGKNELFYFLNDANYFIINENRRSEDNRFLIFGAMIIGKSLLIVILDLFATGKLKHVETFYIEIFRIGMIVTSVKLMKYLPQLVDYGLAYLGNAVGGARLQTYDQSVFKTVIFV